MILRFTSGALLVCLFSSVVTAQNREITAPKTYKPIVAAASSELQTVLDGAVAQSLAATTNIKREEVSAALLDLRAADAVAMASVRGGHRVYPASVVKLFYLAAIQRQIEDGKVRLTPELERGIRDMIVDSSNEATQYILDVLTDTSSGAELPQKEFEAWQYKRNRVNRYFSAMGYQNINVNQKTFCEDAYGIEQQSRGYKGQNRNMLTADATARLMAEIVTGRLASPRVTEKMMTLLRRDPFKKDSGDPDDQSLSFSGRALATRRMTTAKLFSKAGWTSSTRHDVAYFETPAGGRFVLVIFIENRTNDRTALIPAIAGRVLDALTK